MINLFNKENIPNEVLDTLTKLKTHGFKGFIVGGSVRDILLGKAPKDFDICTNATPHDIKRIFNKVLDTGIKFGTVTVLTGAFPIEITTFRKLFPRNHGQRQAVTSYSNCAKEDVTARDFTINSILYDGEKLVDYVNGLSDLKLKLIRAVQPDARFSEDALRMLRAIRLSCQLDFAIESKTYASIKKNSSLIANVSSERIRDELAKILLSTAPAKGFRMLRDTNLLTYILPELQVCSNFDQKNPHHDKDIFEHTMAVLENTPPNLIVRLAALLHDIGKPQTFSIDERGIGHFYGHDIVSFELSRYILARLKFDHKTIDSVGVIVKEHMHKLNTIRKPGIRRALATAHAVGCPYADQKVILSGSIRKTSVKSMINHVGVDKIYLLIDLQIADEIASKPPHHLELFYKLKQEVHRILNEKEPLTLQDLAINGKDLIELGFTPGPKIGNILKQLLEKVIQNPELNSKEALLQIIKHELSYYIGGNQC